MNQYWDRRIVVESPQIPGRGRIDIGPIPEGMTLDDALELIGVVINNLGTRITLEQRTTPEMGYPPNTWMPLESLGQMTPQGEIIPVDCSHIPPELLERFSTLEFPKGTITISDVVVEDPPK